MINSRGTRRRLALAIVGVFAVIGLFTVRLIDLQVVRADELRASADSRKIVTDTVWGTRGDIVDADGTVLATSVDRFNITAAPNIVDLDGFDRIEEVDGEQKRVHVPFMDAVNDIARITGEDPQKLYTALTSDPDSLFTYLARGVKLDVFQQVRALKIPWVFNQPEPARSYPNGAIAGNLVGLMGTDGPLAGTELQWDECLAAQNGSTTYEIGADYVRMPGSEVVNEPAVDGGTAQLAIQADLQWFAQQVLAEQGKQLGADWGTAMVVEVETGRVRAAADWPTIDPNDLDSAKPNDAGARTFTAPYEPGSVIKTATVAALLDAGKVSVGTQFRVPDQYTNGLPPGVRITDAWWHPELHYTTAGILMNSSNIGIAQMIERMPLTQRIEYLKNFGFGSPTGADFLGEEQNAGFVRSLDQTDSVTSVTQQFGQGMTATSAQVASLYQTIGNGGVRIPLTLVEGCLHPDGTVTKAADPEPTRVVSERAANQTVSILETVVSDGGLGPVLKIPGYRIAAKTGTAEVAENGRYGSQRIVSVAGLVPADNPQYAIVVTFAKPDTMRTSAAAAPAFNAIMKQVIKTYRITPSTKPAPEIPLTW